jgi:outer membrane protein OmpA-like peptidoglycan-associated protein
MMLPRSITAMVRPVLCIRKIQGAAVLLLLLAGCAPQPAPTTAEAGRYLVYFDEFSARVTEEAKGIISTAAAKAREVGAKTIRIEGRASATGGAIANQKLAETRTQVVYDELQKDGVDPTTIQQQPIGQTGSGDTGVTERRVDIVLLK